MKKIILTIIFSAVVVAFSEAQESINLPRGVPEGSIFIETLPLNGCSKLEFDNKIKEIKNGINKHWAKDTNFVLFNTMLDSVIFMQQKTYKTLRNENRGKYFRRSFFISTSLVAAAVCCDWARQEFKTEYSGEEKWNSPVLFGIVLFLPVNCAGALVATEVSDDRAMNGSIKNVVLSINNLIFKYNNTK